MRSFQGRHLVDELQQLKEGLPGSSDPRSGDVPASDPRSGDVPARRALGDSPVMHGGWWLGLKAFPEARVQAWRPSSPGSSWDPPQSSMKCVLSLTGEYQVTTEAMLLTGPHPPPPGHWG